MLIDTPPETFAVNTYSIRERGNSRSLVLKNLNFTVAESKYNWSIFDFSSVSHSVYTLPESRPGWSDKDVLLFFTFAGLGWEFCFIKGLHFWIGKNLSMFQLAYFTFKWVVWQRKHFSLRKPTLSDFPVQGFSPSTWMLLLHLLLQYCRLAYT